MKDFELLKAWCHWKRKEKDLSEDDSLFVKDIEDLISLVGTLRAKLAKFESPDGTINETEKS